MPFRILHYETLDSTNNLAKELAELGAEEGTVIFSDYQRKGRGRFKRRWKSPRGKDLLFSIIVRPQHSRANQVASFTHAAGCAVKEVLEHEFGLKAKLKNPNDVLVDGKKICGILVEGSTNSQTVNYLVAGIGLNVNSRNRDLPPHGVSVAMLLGSEQDRSGLLEQVLASFWTHYLAFFKKGS